MMAGAFNSLMYNALKMILDNLCGNCVRNAPLANFMLPAARSASLRMGLHQATLLR